MDWVGRLWEKIKGCQQRQSQCNIFSRSLSGLVSAGYPSKVSFLLVVIILIFVSPALREHLEVPREGQNGDKHQAQPDPGRDLPDPANRRQGAVQVEHEQALPVPPLRVKDNVPREVEHHAEGREHHEDAGDVPSAGLLPRAALRRFEIHVLHHD